ncbi:MULTISPECIES: YusG family protein [Bacillaceae]|uniref:YusG family protein n=1 Tax=Bacillaceae TaxID=186817 RepID=UPI001C56CF2B|nr:MULTISPECIES: YusG family protein [Rossellomorea]MBW3111044.1 YusG family protein [Bacillus sp. MCCB 382]MDX8344207.1 YusG family protein [Rossellomorea sp. YZS02]
MVLEPKKLDVTGRVTGKLKNGEVELYLDNQPIGKMSLPLDGVTLEPNFEAKENKIYQSYTSTDGHDARYTDCDEGGWC